LSRVSDQKKYFLNLSNYLRTNGPITDEIREYLVHSFEGLGKGVDPEIVFGLKRGKGDSLQNELRRKEISFFMHLIACAIQPKDKGGKGITLEDAFEEVSRVARDKVGRSNSNNAYDVDYLKKLWYKNKHLQSPFVSFSKPDAPDYADIN